MSHEHILNSLKLAKISDNFVENNASKFMKIFNVLKVSMIRKYPRPKIAWVWNKPNLIFRNLWYSLIPACLNNLGPHLIQLFHKQMWCQDSIVVPNRRDRRQIKLFPPCDFTRKNKRKLESFLSLGNPIIERSPSYHSLTHVIMIWDHIWSLVRQANVM